MLRAAGAETAEILVLAIDDVEASLRTVENVKKHFPNLKVFARARNRFHAYRLMDLGVDYMMRETLLSSLELGRDVLIELGIPAWDARDTVDTFQRHDERLLERQRAVYHDETKLIQTSNEAAQELEQLFESDIEPDGGDTPAKENKPVFSPGDVR